MGMGFQARVRQLVLSGCLCAVQEYGVVPVLYASQWFLTAFSCPFPTSFSCRVIDVMLTECCGHVMLRVGLAVIKACEPALMQLFDFEDLVTHLKVRLPCPARALYPASLNEEAVWNVGRSQAMREAPEWQNGGLLLVPVQGIRESEASAVCAGGASEVEPAEGASSAQ